ncbi:MAG: hypothetical protein Q9201_004843, partial [Fulgogasparrea decipioides]
MVFRDGIISDPQPTFMEILIAQGGLDLPVFTANFNSTPNGAIPSIEFGKTDRSKYSGKLSTVHVNKSYGNWTVDNIIFEVNGAAALYNQSMIFDTGAASYMYADPPLTAFYYHQHNVPSAVMLSNGAWTVDCDAVLPDFSMWIGNGTAVVPGKLMNSGGSMLEKN